MDFKIDKSVFKLSVYKENWLNGMNLKFKEKLDFLHNQSCTAHEKTARVGFVVGRSRAERLQATPLSDSNLAEIFSV